MLWTAIALCAFAANSWCCRLALRSGDIDPATFTLLRLASGALVLQPIARTLEGAARAGSLASAAALLLYAVTFSFAYVSLDAGVGALVLFGSVQATMIGRGLALGERPGAPSWIGLSLAMAGLFYLVAPGISAPSLAGSLSMAAAGAAWGAYSLRGRGERSPVGATAGNFLRATPGAVVALAIARLAGMGLHASPRGIVLAVLSGAVASGLGYVVWYKALGGMSATTAGIVQLAVPVLTALGGTLFLGEKPGMRLALAATLILGGVSLALLRAAARRRAA